LNSFPLSIPTPRIKLPHTVKRLLLTAAAFCVALAARADYRADGATNHNPSVARIIVPDSDGRHFVRLRLVDCRQ